MASNIYCKVNGIPGEAKEKPDYFEVQSFSFGVSQQTSGTVGGTGGHVGGKPNFDGISVVKQVDKSSSTLALYCAQGKHIPDVVIECYRNLGDSKASKYLEYKLTKAFVQSIQLSGSPESMAMETVVFGWEKLNWEYTEYDNAGKKGAVVPHQWDGALNTGS